MTYMKTGTATPLSHYLYGIRRGSSIVLAFISIGIAYAAAARSAGFSVGQTIGASAMVFAGSSQIMAAGMVKNGAGLFAIALATFIINLRHFIMSTCVVNRMKNVPAPLRALLSFFVTDESFALFGTEEENKATVFTYLGIITMTYTSWITGSAIGAVLMGVIPEKITAAFGIAIYAMFLALIAPSANGNRRLGLLVMFTAFVNCVLSLFLSGTASLIISTLGCALAGVFFVELDGEGGGSEAGNGNTKNDKGGAEQ